MGESLARCVLANYFCKGILEENWRCIFVTKLLNLGDRILRGGVFFL